MADVRGLCVVDFQAGNAGSIPVTRSGKKQFSVVIGDLEATAEVAQRTIAGYALIEINRIITDLAEPI